MLLHALCSLRSDEDDDALALGGGGNPNKPSSAAIANAKQDGEVVHNHHMANVNIVAVTTESESESESDDDDDADAIWIPPDEAAADRMEDDDEPTSCYHATRAGGTSTSSYCTDEDDESDDDATATRSSIRWCHDHDHDQSAVDREERQKAMLRAMNGQLRMLAARFLESAGIDTTASSSNSNSCCCWLDIVTSLSWEAALVIKPDVSAAVGNQMDPSSYIKVKCLASGTPRQCEVIKGLVFRKSVAHKHMPTKCHNPRLLLLSGVLGHSHIGFSSFSSIEQEKDHLHKSVCKMMEICRPNVVMVEKTVSRDIQELLLQEGATLVLDMKLNRLQRIARCSGAPILSFSEVPSKPKLKQCDYFHIEKVTEEHNLLTCSTGVGKRPSKTLMFLEGFHKPLGCTILLRGANTEELKKIKQVMHYTVFAAYRLVLETSFFEDQRLILNNKSSSKEEVSVIRKAGPSSLGSVQESTDEVPLEKSFPNELREGSVINYDSNQPLPSERLVSAVPDSPRRFIDIFRYHNIYLPVTASQVATDHQIEDRPQYNEGMTSNGIHISPNVGVPIGSGENVDHLSDPQEQASSGTNQQMTLGDPLVSEKHEQSLEKRKDSTSYNNGGKTSDIDEVDDVLESQSILILLSSQCITKPVICEQSRLSRIRYYGNFDVSLGRYLQDILQKQNLSCSSCGEPPEAHMYSYTHRNGNLTVLVKRLLPKYRLPGESEGKIWMWTRCLRCEHESGISRSSRRVIMSTEAHYLSFGKFLELSFSSHSTARRMSICGHSLNRDCLRFFGLGSKVALFQYSSVEIYNACKPQPTLEFHNPNMHEWYGQEVRNVLATGVTLFSEVTSVLQKLKDQFPELAIHCGAFIPVKDFSQLEEMLIKEKAEFMDSLAKAVDRNRESGSMDDILNVNWLYQDLLLELYVWDHRVHQLLDCTSAENAVEGNGITETSEFTGDQTAAVAEAGGIGEPMSSKESFENRCIEPQKLPSSGTTNCLGVQSNIPQRCDREKWVWNPLNESRLAYRQDLEVGCLERFEVVNHYCPTHLSPLYKHKQSAEETGSPQFTVGPGGSVLCVSEDEISSIISRALAISEDYRHLLMDAIAEIEPADIRGREYAKTMEKSYSSLSESSSASLSWSSSSGSSDSEASISSEDLPSYDSSLLSSSLHPEISVNGRIALKGKYSVICVHSNQFYNLRRKCCPSELAYITSLSRCKKWDAQGGKSKAFFAKTMDDRLIIKQIKKTEFESFIKFAPDYFKHVNHSLDTGSQTCLAKILGIYQVKQIRHGKEIKMDLMVMENILFGHNVSRTYDLKGTVFSRYVSHSNDHGTVYLDQNFVDDMRVSPIYIGGRAKHLLERAIWNDTSFLTSINVMDYSLLVGVDRQKHEIVFGIIDYLRQYTWDKQLETMVKASLVMPKNESPTVISPRDYKKRFRKFMSKHFLTVPDDWRTENPPSVACESCAHAGNTTKLPGVIDEKPQHPSPILACA